MKNKAVLSIKVEAKSFVKLINTDFYCKIILQMEPGTPLVSQGSQFQESLPAKFSLKIVPWSYRMIIFGRLQFPSQSW